MPKFLFKLNNDVLSHCQCVDEPAMSTGQVDCPWCGCGWLISCSKCLKSFTYAEIRETDTPLVLLGQREAVRRGLKSVDKQDVQRWASEMANALARFEIGQVVVYLDGEYWPLDARDVSFEGYFAKHHLKVLPHAEALTRPAVLRELLGDKSYWLDRERPNRD